MSKKKEIIKVIIYQDKVTKRWSISNGIYWWTEFLSKENAIEFCQEHGFEIVEKLNED